ncbi:cytohesin-1 [Pimephales promelas]|nr:cytohesin-1 [Pimephales promelas]
MSGENADRGKQIWATRPLPNPPPCHFSSNDEIKTMKASEAALLSSAKTRRQSLLEASQTRFSSGALVTSSVSTRCFISKIYRILYAVLCLTSCPDRLKDEIAEVTSEIENLGSTEERKNMQRNKQVAMGRKKFNMDPKKGIQFLIENDLLKNTSEDIARFLYKGEGLNKTAIGDYLGERDELNLQVLHAFVELHEFTDLNLVQALRQFLWSFRLPGEAQKIDRMMEAFAQRYCQCNPGVFQSTDTCYILSFAIIMLNTSLHNPNVKDKPPVERFISMNRGINEGGDLPEDLLRNLYDSIKNEPFKIPEDDGNDLTHTFFNPDREGWLLKLGGRVKTWKRRWFILTDNCLYYFEYTTNCFELFIPDNKDQVIKACKTEADGRVVEGNHTFYRISAPTTEEKDEWMNSIKAAISRDPFYEMLAARKKKVSSVKRH